MTIDVPLLAGAMIDSFKAALVGLNPLAVLVLAVLIGLGQAQRKAYVLKALACTVAGVIITSLWPQIAGEQPAWPDVTQLEPQIQMGILIVMAYVVIRLFDLVKNSFSLNLAQTSKA